MEFKPRMKVHNFTKNKKRVIFLMDKYENTKEI